MADFKEHEVGYNPYFEGLQGFLKEKFKKDKWHLRDLADALGRVENLTDISPGRHQRTLSDILGHSQAGELLGLISEFQGKFMKQHPKAQGINFYNPQHSVHLQSIMEAVEKASR